MNATELYELVRPLIGSACEPKGLEFDDGTWSLSGGYDTLPVPAACAMWEVAILDWLFTLNPDEEIDTFRIRRGRRSLWRIDNYNPKRLVAEGGPTRLHALVIAARSVLKC